MAHAHVSSTEPVPEMEEAKEEEDQKEEEQEGEKKEGEGEEEGEEGVEKEDTTVGDFFSFVFLTTFSNSWLLHPLLQYSLVIENKVIDTHE